MGVEEVVAEAAVAEGAVLGEAAQGVVDGADGEVGGAAEDEVELLADGDALGAGVGAGAGVAELGDQEAGLALLVVDGMGDVGEEEDGHAEEFEGGLGGLGLAAVEGDLAGEEVPVRVGEKAGGDRAVVDGVVGGAGFDDEAALEDEGVGVLIAGQAGAVLGVAMPALVGLKVGWAEVRKRPTEPWTSKKRPVWVRRL